MTPQPSRIFSIRISLSLALLASASVCVLNIVKVKERITSLEGNLKQQIAARRVAEMQSEAVTAKLRETALALEVATEERQQAIADALVRSRRAEELSAALAVSQRTRENAEVELSRFRAAGMEPEQIVFAARDLSNLRGALATAEEQKKLLEQKLRFVQVNEGPEIWLPAEIKGKVILSDPKWRFVVLDLGSDQGIVKNAELLLSRNSKLVAKVKISSVQKAQSIANLLPGWELSEIAEGDLAIPAHPHS